MRHLAEFRQNLAAVDDSADVRAFAEQVREHRLWIASGDHVGV
jgi:hypothetical protein